MYSRASLDGHIRREVCARINPTLGDPGADGGDEEQVEAGGKKIG